MSVVCPSLRSLRHQHRRQWQQCQSARVLSRLQIIEIITLHPKTHLESSGKSLWPPQLIRVIITTVIIISIIIIIIRGSSNSISIIDINGKIVIFLSSSEPSLCGVKHLISFEHEDCESNHKFCVFWSFFLCCYSNVKSAGETLVCDRSNDFY